MAPRESPFSARLCRHERPRFWRVPEGCALLGIVGLRTDRDRCPRWHLFMPMLVLLGACVAIEVPQEVYDRYLTYQPVPAKGQIAGRAALVVQHTISDEWKRRWRKWNPESDIVNWERAVTDKIAEDMLVSGLFAEMQRGKTAAADVIVRVETRETIDDDYEVRGSLTLVDPVSGAGEVELQR